VGHVSWPSFATAGAIIRHHLRHQIRNHYTGDKLKLLVDGNHKEAAKVCRAENGDDDAVDEEQAAHWRNVDALTRTLQEDVRTASASTPDKLRTDTRKTKKRRESEQSKKQDKYNKGKKGQ